MELKSKKNLNVVLVEPEIPNNTGNIGRTCVSLEASLHLVGPLGFDLEEKKLRRAGLDYWPHLDLHLYKNQEEFFSKLESSKSENTTVQNSISMDFADRDTKIQKKDQLAFLTTKTDRSYFDADFSNQDYSDLWLIFGKETKGLSEDVRQRYCDDLYTIPMIGKTRSLNLANSVAIVLYEAYRQIIS